jgi:hypothetical protein
MELIGELERAFATALYPNRVLVAAIGFAILVVLALVAWRRRWDRIARRRPRLTTTAAVVALAVALPVGWYLGSPLFVSSTADDPAPTIAIGGQTSMPSTAAAANPSPTAAPTARALTERRGQFEGADEFHFGKGTARLIETAPGVFTVRLENFEVRNGPDLYVYLSPSATGYANGAVELSRLKADRGNQNYAVRPGTDVRDARSVVIWCKQFAVLFATATLS